MGRQPLLRTLRRLSEQHVPMDYIWHLPRAPATGKDAVVRVSQSISGTFVIRWLPDGLSLPHSFPCDGPFIIVARRAPPSRIRFLVGPDEDIYKSTKLSPSLDFQPLPHNSTTCLGHCRSITLGESCTECWPSSDRQ